MSPQEHGENAAVARLGATAWAARVEQTARTIHSAGIRSHDVRRLMRRQVDRLACARTRSVSHPPQRSRARGARRPSGRSTQSATRTSSRGDPDDDGPGEARPLDAATARGHRRGARRGASRGQRRSHRAVDVGLRLRGGVRVGLCHPERHGGRHHFPVAGGRVVCLICEPTATDDTTWWQWRAGPANRPIVMGGLA
jgi:hypothetical protein